MKRIICLSLLLGFFTLSGCGRKNVPKVRKERAFVVKIGNKIEKATVIAGFHGFLREEGFIAQPDSTSKKKVKMPRNEIYIYTASDSAEIHAAGLNGINSERFNLKQIDAIPEFIICPNKKGFYQMDLGDGYFYAFIKTKKNELYQKGGASKLSSSRSELKPLDFIVPK